MNILIPMAGLGSRFIAQGYVLPKPLIEVEGIPLIEHSVKTLNIKGRYIFITRKYDNPEYNVKLSSIFATLGVDYIEISIDSLTSGAAETCLKAKKFINNEEPLIITNSDQYMTWDSVNYMKSLKNQDGSIVLHKSNDLKNSFAIVLDGKVLEVAEKRAISSDALVGIHYYKYGRYFVEAAENLILNFTKTGSPETFVSETFNFLISKGKMIEAYFIGKGSYNSLGTPEDIQIFLSKTFEFNQNKPKTIFCDLDGTILKHVHKYSDINSQEATLLEGVIGKFNEWDSIGHKIILTSARKESARDVTEFHLQKLGIPYDYLLMGITSGVRVLINDKLNQSSFDRSIAINVITDSGFQTVSWEKYGL